MRFKEITVFFLIDIAWGLQKLSMILENEGSQI